MDILADVTEIYNTVQDCGIFNDDLDKHVLWAKEWLLPFNINKSNILYFCKTTLTLNIIWMKNLFLQAIQ